MPALRTRQAVRERVMKVLAAQLDRLLPADEAVPLPGQTFREWEDQADEFDRTVTAALLEELAAAQASAQVDQGGRCPHCGSDRVYLDRRGDERQTEVRTNHGGGGGAAAELSMPVMWPVFFPLRTGIGACRWRSKGCRPRRPSGWLGR